MHPQRQESCHLDLQMNKIISKIIYSLLNHSLKESSAKFVLIKVKRRSRSRHRQGKKLSIMFNCVWLFHRREKLVVVNKTATK